MGSMSSYPDGTWSDEAARNIFEQVTKLITQRSQEEGGPLEPLGENELFHSVIGTRPGYLRGQRRGLSPAEKQITAEVQMERGALEEKLGEMKQKLQEESAAKTVIQEQLQAETAARAEMEARLQAESAARTAMEARQRAKFMVALDSLRSQTSSSSATIIIDMLLVAMHLHFPTTIAPNAILLYAVGAMF
ncbi:hypothetical protein CJ030_MR1G007977 [Morella rubra]|uniref:Uncharacterized protein n=1 Tax=Morella rubra TaxID=262757 RepID=A0A6A1WTG4_9ROSI|nr:hypothetical protein CJ030_MR1G007977 [Morella rubra]